MEKAPPYAEPVPFNLEFAVLFLMGLLPSRAHYASNCDAKIRFFFYSAILQFDL